MANITATWTGIRPLVMHNGLMADPTNPYTVKIKKITSKGSKKMTDADHEDRNRLEWEAGLYWSTAMNCIVMPSDNIERCIQLGAQKSRIGKDVQAAVFCDASEYKVEYEFKGAKTKDNLYANPAFVLRRGVAVNMARIIRVRPMVPTGWSIKFSLSYDETIVNRASLKAAMEDAGALVGLGDWRPKFGRFLVEIE